MKRFKNSLGFSLTEICVGMCIMAILATIAGVSYNGLKASIAKKNLKTSDFLFAKVLQNCVTAKGGWLIKHPKGSLEPCKAGDTTDTTDDTADLKDKLKYNCPGPPDKVKCKTHAHPNRKDKYPAGDPKGRDGKPKKPFQYYCLSIEKEVSATKKLQVYVRFPLHNPKAYELWCGEVANADVVAIAQANCRAGQETKMSPLNKTCPWK